MNSAKTEVLSVMSEKLSDVLAARTVKTKELSASALTPTQSNGRNPFVLPYPPLSNKRRRMESTLEPTHSMTPRTVSTNLVIYYINTLVSYKTEKHNTQNALRTFRDSNRRRVSH